MKIRQLNRIWKHIRGGGDRVLCYAYTNLGECYHNLFRRYHPNNPQHYRTLVSIGYICFDHIGIPNLNKSHCRLCYRFAVRMMFDENEWNEKKEKKWYKSVLNMTTMKKKLKFQKNKELIGYCLNLTQCYVWFNKNLCVKIVS